MKPDETKALRVAAVTIKNAGNLLAVAREFSPNGKPDAISSRSLKTLAERSLTELREARYIVEAHSSSGSPFPALAVELCDLLAAGEPEWLAYLMSNHADAWRAEARAIMAAVGRPEDQGREKEREGKGEPPTYPHLNTKKSRQALRQTFDDLVENGFILAKDPETGADMWEGFLNAFDEDSEGKGIVWSNKTQGRIIWAKEHGPRENRKPNKSALIDFLSCHGVKKWEDRKTLAAAVFGIELTKNEKTKYGATEFGNSRFRDELERIIR